MSSDDIGFDDPTDFTTTQLQVLDEHLRCPICKELFNTTMLLSTCSHSFCALCIRRSLSAEQKCPKCRKEGIEKNLIHNYDLDNVVRSWKDSRKLLVSLDKPSSTTKEPTEIQVPIGQHNDDFQPSRSISQNTSVAPNARRSTRISSQTKPNYVEIQSNTYPETSEPHRQLNLAQNQPLPAPPAPIDQVQPYSADYPIHFNPTISNYQPLPQMQYSYTTQPTPPPPPPSMPSSSTTSMSSHTSRPPENMVECPICQQSMHQTVVNIHLDRCLKGDRSIPVINQSSSHQSPLSSNPRPSVMNTLPIAKKKSSVNLGQKPIKQVFGVMKDKQIKSLLKSFNLPDSGDRKQMIWRYTEYVTMWNANNDSEAPVSAQVLVQRLQRMENSMLAEKSSQLKRKNEDADTHKAHYKDEYSRLIDEVKRRK